MRKVFAIMIFLAMLCGAISTGTGTNSFGAGSSVVYAGGTAPMDGRVDRP